MKKLILSLLASLFIAGNAFAQCQTTIDGFQNCHIDIIDGNAVLSPAVSATSQGRIYYDFTDDKWKCSEDGAAFVDFCSAAAASGTGSTVTFEVDDSTTTSGTFTIDVKSAVFAINEDPTDEMNLFGIVEDAIDLDELNDGAETASDNDFVQTTGTLIKYRSASEAIEAGTLLTWTGTQLDVDTITLGTNTTGNYVATVIGGDGVSSTGATTGEGIAHTLSVDLEDLDAGGSTTGSASGLELVNGELTLVQGCDDTEIMKWDNTAGRWQCQPDTDTGLTDVTGSSLLDGRFWIGDGSNLAAEILISGDILFTNAGVGTIQANAVALTTDTTGNYADGDGEAGNALTGDTATAFFSSGTIEHERGGHEADVSAYDGLVGITGGATFNQTGTDTQIIIFDGSGAPTSASLSSDVTMTNAGVVTIQPNAVAMATDTSGDFVGTITGGDGIASTGATTGEDIDHTLSIDLEDVDSGGATTGSVSGLELISGELTLINGCSNNEVVAWDDTDGRWQCAASGSGTPAGSDTEIQFNTSGAFDANSNLIFDGGMLKVGTSIVSTATGDTSFATTSGTIIQLDHSADVLDLGITGTIRITATGTLDASGGGIILPTATEATNTQGGAITYLSDSNTIAVGTTTGTQLIGGFKFLGVTEGTSGATTSAVTLEDNKFYKIYFYGIKDSTVGNDVIYARFNSDESGTNYSWADWSQGTGSVGIGEAHSSATDDPYVTALSASTPAFISIDVSTYSDGTADGWFLSLAMGYSTAVAIKRSTGYTYNGGTVTSIEFDLSGGAFDLYKIWLYEAIR